MFLNDVNKKEEIKNLALQDLRSVGIKFRLKKSKQNVQDLKSRKAFKTPLSSLTTQTVTLPSGQQLIIPKLVHELCSFILTKVHTEGLFRKGGSKSRQNEIRLLLDAGCYLGQDHHEIDVASVLKTFFRELPEPLFPYVYHELFLRCIILPSNNLNAVLLACLLLPSEHLNTLAYFMQFLYQVTEYSMLNKMDAYNLAVVIGPTLLPIEEKLAPHATHRLTKICELFKLLVENASAIGVVPESIIERIALSSSSTSLTDEDSLSLKKKKKRRSGSLTRMFNGLKKIVSSKPPEEIPAITPDLLMTPCATRSAKKRKFENTGFSIRKKKEILNKLPQNAALSTPYTPVSVNPNPKRKTPESCPKTVPTKEGQKNKDKKHHWSLRSKNSKSSKSSDDASVASSKTSVNSKSLLERRWSQVSSQMVTFRKNKKRNSCTPSLPQDHQKSESDQSNSDINKDDNDKTPTNEGNGSEYVKISKAEYEEIKYRVTEIERRISIELENPNVNLNKQLNTIENVQDAYEQTLEQAKPLSPTTDQLARRLSRELKIRRSAEQKIIRSPSARKIGSIRRRSRELEKQTNTTKQNWYVSELNATPKASINRRKSNVSCKLVNVNNEASYENVESLKKVTTRSSFHGESIITKPKPQIRRYSNCTTNSDKWQNADGFFRGSLTPRNSGENGRASLARLRSQNAGMVMAKAKLFDGLVSSDNSSSKDTPVLIPRVRSNKMGSIRNADRQSYRIRTLKTEDRKVLKKKYISAKKNL
ncbi:rho gtpase activating protein 11a [Holotrichia oblita]|uniref:Rho gtpase activating protein 11a n=1 Tax=Holotrichia oblita TaxID=644536 RepID=A0ACB9TLH6_HOLOL|nr:rho gtpase activating protein 11a [Holotrichia oblita]